MPDRNLEQSPLGTEDRTPAKVLRDVTRIERRRHDNDPQVGPRALQAL